ncbi:MAG: NAD-dependent epimerase/dehydratase family protein [Actinomycetota bacterium]|nr:NAD-dependent epimerase/dehydratase family protein [Actinomycetota bacterium]
MTTPQACTGRVVITGGVGFVGRAAVAAFIGRGNPVTVVDRRAHPIRRCATSSVISPSQN